MRHGVVIPSAREPEIVELIRLAEDSGWDGAFSWESVWGHHAWVALGAAAAVTERVRLGTLLTPAPRWKPWDLATAVASLDRLSGGRAILGVGLGTLHGNWLAFERDEGRAVRARRLDEVLDVYAGLMAGQPFTYAGEFFTVREVTELVPPPPVQTPHPPVWCVGAYVPDRSRQRSLERAARWQGVFPATVGGGQNSGLTLESLTEIVARLRDLRAEAGLPWEGYDVVVEGDSYGGFGTVFGPVEPWERAGATWWVESWWDLMDEPDGMAEVRRRIVAGPRR